MHITDTKFSSHPLRGNIVYIKPLHINTLSLYPNSNCEAFHCYYSNILATALDASYCHFPNKINVTCHHLLQCTRITWIAIHCKLAILLAIQHAPDNAGMNLGNKNLRYTCIDYSNYALLKWLVSSHTIFCRSIMYAQFIKLFSALYPPNITALLLSMEVREKPAHGGGLSPVVERELHVSAVWGMIPHNSAMSNWHNTTRVNWLVTPGAHKHHEGASNTAWHGTAMH